MCSSDLVRVDIPAAQLVLEVALVGSQARLEKVDLEDCKATLASHKIILSRPKVVPVRVALVGRTHMLAEPKVFPERVVLVGHEHTPVEPKVILESVVLVG